MSAIAAKTQTVYTLSRLFQMCSVRSQSEAKTLFQKAKPSASLMSPTWT